MNTKIYSLIAIAFIIFAIIYSMFDSNAKDNNSFILIGTKFSEFKTQLNDNYTTTETAEGRITYSFLGRNDNLTLIAVKDDIIEVIEVYNVFDNSDDAYDLFEDLVVRLTIDGDCKLLRAYNSTMEFTRGNILIRVDQIPVHYGWLVKFTAYEQ
jgi:hypothetical protein